MSFHIDIVSLAGNIFSGEIERISVPAIEGEMTILARHMPVVAPLGVGEVVVKSPGKTLNLSIGKGIFEFSGGRARLLVEDAINSDEISEDRALEAKKRAEELLAKGIKGEEKLEVTYQLRKSLIDLKIVRRKKKRVF